MARQAITVERMDALARDKLGFESLYPIQRDIIQSVVGGQDTLAIMPTGSGKSAIYQIAELLLAGPAVIVSPLLALQRDQVRAIDDHEVGEAAAVNSSIPSTEREQALEALEEGDLEFLFTAPEQFRHEETLERLKAAQPSLFVVDEAHCISEWGDDFRPDYMRLGAVIDELGHPVVLALTATAAPPVREEIVERLGMREPRVVVAGFNRPNIWLGAQHFHDEQVKQEALLEAVERAEKPGIVYVSTRHHAEDLAAALNERGISALAYHAGMRSGDRTGLESDFMAGEADVMVSTNAFGMGIDKQDVRFVFHLDIPESVDSYYQEIGRAGRDGQPARAVLFYRSEDLNLHRFFAGTGKIDPEQVERVVRAIEQHEGAMDPNELRDEVNLSRAKLTTSLARLEDAGALEVLPTGEVEVEGEGAGGDIVHEVLEIEERRRAVDRSRLDMMRGYAETQNCRRANLLSYFGEQFTPPCGYCDNCDAGRVKPEDATQEPFPVGSRVRHGAFGEGTLQRYEGDEMIVLFEDAGYKTLLTEFVVESGALEFIRQ